MVEFLSRGVTWPELCLWVVPGEGRNENGDREAVKWEKRDAMRPQPGQEQKEVMDQ